MHSCDKCTFESKDLEEWKEHCSKCDNKIRITEDHIKLLKRAYWGMSNCEYGAPEMDCKRPYGNSSVEHDIAEILGWKIVDEDEDESAYEKMAEKAHEIHYQLADVIQQMIREYKVK